MLIDITPTLSCDTPVYPGDSPFSVAWTVPREETLSGGACVSEVSLSPHAGAHVDAPMHLSHEGADAASMPLSTFIGPAAVIDLRAALQGRRRAASSMLSAEDWRRIDAAPRVLLRTRSEHPAQWTDDFAGVEPELIERLALRGVKLIGIDTPSADPMAASEDADPLAAHHAAAAHGMVILENLRLSDAPAGMYELIALPLKWAGAEASPVRAMLRTPCAQHTHTFEDL